MPDHNRLGATFGLASSVVLPALVLLASIWPSASVTASSRPDFLRSDFTVSLGHATTYLSATTATNSVRNLKALASENEEEEEGADALVEPRVSFLSLGSFRKVPERKLFSPRSILSHYPLRC